MVEKGDLEGDEEVDLSSRAKEKRKIQEEGESKRRSVYSKVQERRAFLQD